MNEGYNNRKRYNTFGNTTSLKLCKEEIQKSLIPKEKMKEWKEQLKALQALQALNLADAFGEMGIRIELPFPDFFTKDEWQHLYEIFGGENSKYFPRFDCANADINVVDAYEFQIMVILKVLFNEIEEETIKKNEL